MAAATLETLPTAAAAMYDGTLNPPSRLRMHAACGVAGYDG